MEAYQTERLALAGRRFAAFFHELRGAFVERETILEQIALALLCREHVLMTGPPGTAKSKLAAAVLGRILDETTGEPSLFARQFTESTVQTDLVGPIDFKTLMETGRTEHFTDEGMLGAVHAFLDEVFDGRDMLLRSTLNVLHERELKQGTRVTRGHIECALMTSNRYLSEILESSRETLLAFVDRVAFLSFVPKGFAAPESLAKVLRAEVAGSKPRALGAALTVQDLDVLQDAAASVFVPDWLCDRLAEFSRSFEAELMVARRADPTFVPARYLSTRTLVRLGRVLRAACVLDWAQNDRSRPLRAQQTDMSKLRLSLVLCGPTAEELALLEVSETDPREARQIAIMRTEHEIFARCFKKLKPAVATSQQAQVSEALLARTAPGMLASHDDKALMACAQELATAATSGALQVGTASIHLEAAVKELTQRAFRTGLATSADETLERLASRFLTLADDLERTNPEQRSVARWLRGRALEAVIHTLDHAPLDLQRELAELIEDRVAPEKALAMSEGRLERLLRLGSLIQALRASGAIERGSGALDETWQKALSRIEDSLVGLWDDALRAAVASALVTAQPGDLAAVLDLLATPLSELDQVARRFAALGAPSSALKERVVGPRVAPFVQAAFERFDARDRASVATQVEGVLSILRGYGLERAIPPEDILSWCAEALLRSEPQQQPADEYSPDHDGYRRLRNADQRSSLAFVLADIALRILPELTKPSNHPDEVVAGLGRRLAGLSESVRARVAARDLERIERPVSLLERYWAAVSGDLPADPLLGLTRLAQSGFFAITADEAALSRFSLELDLITLMALGADPKPVAARIRLLEERSSGLVRELARSRSEANWRKVVRSAKNP
jgi:MoxR-like ATPase